MKNYQTHPVKVVMKKRFGTAILVIAMVLIPVVMTGFMNRPMAIIKATATSANEADDYLSAQRKADFLILWQEAKEYSLAVAEAMPAKHYRFKPSKVDSVRTFAQQFKHLGALNFGVAKIYLQDEAPTAPDPEFENKDLEKEKIIGFLTASYDVVSKAVTSLSPKQLEEMRPLLSAPNQPEFSKFIYLDFLRDHNTHHRAQAISYLRAKGLAPSNYQFVPLD